MNKKKVLIILLIAIVLVICFGLLNNSFKRYDINRRINSYDLQKSKDEYIDYLKESIYPIKLREFIDNDYITFSQYNDTATGHSIKNQMEFVGYEILFNSMFDKERTNFDDCPVTDKFKEKFSGNLLDYFKLKESEDCESMCSLYRKDREIVVEVYGNFKNTEPTYWTKHHFHYTLDDEGNVDDIIFDHTDN